jgi:[protein-PII] uridylyltransferase
MQESPLTSRRASVPGRHIQMELVCSTTNREARTDRVAGAQHTRSSGSETRISPSISVEPRTAGESLLSYGRRLHRSEMQRLKMKHRAGLGGAEVVAHRCEVLDFLVKEILSAVVTQAHGAGQATLSEMTVVAIGGYGRRELAPFSDVDLMFLRANRHRPADAKKIQEVLCLLWDMGFQIGHSVRTVKDAMRMAEDDLISLNSMLDARLITGAPALFAEFEAKLQKTTEKNRAALRRKVLESLDERHLNNGGTAFIQEPDIKEAKGGLRDFHTIGWIQKIFHCGLTSEQVLDRHGVSMAEWKRAAQAYHFLQRLRNELHFLTDRRTDRLSHHLLPAVVRNFNFRGTRFQKDSEAFLKHYYLQVRRIAQILDALRSGIQSESKTRTTWLGSKLTQLAPFKPGSKSIDGRDAKAEVPEHWMRVFRYSQATPSLLDESSKVSIRQAAKTFSRLSFSTPSIAADFRAVLRMKGRVAPVIRQMHSLGFLGRVLPEFGRLTCLAQHDQYHKYTTDEHTLRALDILDEVALGSHARFVPYQKVLHEIHDSSSLYFAMLMHDVGKGLGGGHSVKGAAIVSKALGRLGFDPDEGEKIQTLVRHHLLMTHFSQRRNLDDPHTVEEFVKVIDRLDTLNMLLLLTYADAQAIGPGVWTDWKDYLLWDLYYKAYDRLMFNRSSSPASRQEIQQIRRQVVRLLRDEMSVEELEDHFNRLPEQYVVYTPLQQLVEQIRLARRLQNTDVVMEWAEHPEQGYSDLILVTRDHPGLFAQIAGGLSAFNLNILSAQLNTRDDGLVFDVFQVGNLAGTHRLQREDYPRVERLLKRVISGQTDIAEYLKKHSPQRQAAHPARDSFPPRIHIENETSPLATVIEVQTGDRLGLGYQIAKTLASLNLNIVFAKLATEKAHAFDVFHVHDAGGRKIVDVERLRQLEEKLRAGLLDL